MGSSIQEYLKKINSELSIYSCASIFVTTLCMLLLVLLGSNTKASASELSYTSNQSSYSVTSGQSVESSPFASKKGKTYTFSWCQGSTRISVKNKIYFKDESTAQASGRTLSKLCKK